MSLRRVSLLAALMLSLGSAVAFANLDSLLPQAVAQDMENQGRPERGKARLTQELNLTPRQTQQIEEIQNQYQDQISQRKQALRQANQELVDLMAGTAPQEQVREKYNQVATLKQEVAKLRFDNMLAMREVLTPEQRRQVAQRLQNWRGDHQNRERYRGKQG